MFATFNHDQLRRYILAFGSFFDNISVVRNDAAGVETQRLRVPIEYGPKEKWLAHIIQDPDFQQSVAITVPRIAFELGGISYDTSRKLNTLNQLKCPPMRTYVGVLYLLTFNLEILVKFQSDGFQIVEQIFPYFTPDLTFAIRTLPELGIIDQIPLTLNSVAHTDNYEGDFEKRRIIIWSLRFAMKVNFYGPTKSSTAGRIEEVEVDVYNSPYLDLLDPPQYLVDQDGTLIANEDDTHIATEATSDGYLETGVAERVTITLDPRDQMKTSDPTVIITRTETP